MVYLFLSVIQEKRSKMAEEEVKEVFFDRWCPSCKHIDKSESEDPCWDCLEQGWNINSHRPIFWDGDLDAAIKSQKAQA